MVGGEGPGMALTSQVHKLQLLVPGVQIQHLLPLWVFSVFSKKSSASSSHSVSSYPFLCFLDSLLHLLLFVAVSKESTT